MKYVVGPLNKLGGDHALFWIGILAQISEQLILNYRD